jgi:uncharacterized protein (DUF433 family)
MTFTCGIIKRERLESDKAWSFDMNNEIVVDSKVCSGKPVIRGTRIMVKNILGMVAGGYTLRQIVEAYPELTPEQVQAALEYAAEVVDEEQVIAGA